MHLELPDPPLRGTGLTPALAKLEIAVALYRDRKLTISRAAALAEMPRLEFQKALAARGVTMDIDFLDYQQDLLALQKLFPQ